MLMRGLGSLPISSSGGGGTLRIIMILPSAALVTRPALVGVTRAGSRKKYATQPASAANGQNSGCHSSQASTATTAASSTNGQPSRLTGAATEERAGCIAWLSQLAVESGGTGLRERARHHSA